MNIAIDRPASAAASQAPGSAAALAANPIVGRRWSDGGAFVSTDPNAPWSMTQQWPNLVAALSEQAVESSNLLLRALNYLVGAGRLRRTEAKALCDAMHQLRATSLRAQQITRLASGRIRQSHERVDPSDLVTKVLQERQAELAAAGATVRSQLEPVDVLLDPPVAISLLNSVLDWALSFSKEIVFTMERNPASGPAQLKVRVTTPPPRNLQEGGPVVRPRGRRLNDGLHWMMLRQTAASSGLEVRRTREDGVALLTIDFPRTFMSSEGVACLELHEPAAGGNGAAAGDAWVLVISGDEKIRAESVEALRRMGMDAVAVRDAQEARNAVADSRPNVLVTAFDVPEEDVTALRTEVLGGEERIPLVEITRELPSFHLSGFDRFETPKVGREQLSSELPPTVLFELVKI